MNKHKRKITTLILIFIFMMLFSTTSFASSDPPKAGILEKTVSVFIRALAYFIDAIFFNSDSGNSIDNLVFNRGIRSVGILDGGSSELNELRTFILEFYKAFRYIAITLFIPMGLYIAVYFTRTKDAQGKAILKDKILRFFTTIVLLTTMPEIISIIFKINYAFVDVFYSIGKNIVANSASTVQEASSSVGSEGFLIASFKAEAESSGTIISAVAYLISTFLNVWMLFYYFIRDITMAFLFVLFPIIAIFYPFQSNMVVTWFKEMSANIFTQAIHSAILTFVVAMSLILPTTFTNLVFTMTAFACVIPMTGIVKRFLGLEGSIGGAKSMAGMGMLLGAVQMGRMASSNIRHNTSNFLEGRRELKDLKTQELELSKNMTGSDDTSRELPRVNGAQPLSFDDIKAKKAQARNKMLKGVGGLAGGSYLGAISTIGGTAFGAKSAMVIGAGGTMIGSKIGDTTGGLGARAINEGIYQKEKYSALMGEEGTWEENLAKYTGVEAPVLDGIEIEDNSLINKGRKKLGLGTKTTTLKAQMQRAELKRKRLNALGLQQEAKHSYAKLMPKQSSQEELDNIKNAKLYQDNNMSILYSENDRGEKEIFSFGEGDTSLSTGIVRDVTMNNGDLSLDPTRERELFEDATAKAFEITQIDPSISIKDAENDPQWKMARNKEFSRLEKTELDGMQKARTTIGAKGLTFKSEARNVHQGNNLITEKEVQQFANQYTQHLENADMQRMGFLEENIPNGFGAILKSQEGTTLIRFAQDENGTFKPDMSKVVAVGGENPSLGTNSRQVAPVKFMDGEILRGEFQSALEGNTFSKDTAIDFPAKKMQGAYHTNPKGINPNNEIVVTVNNGNYNYYNNDTKEFIATSPVPEQFREEDIQGTTYHVKVDATGQNFTQFHRGQQMTVHDWHTIAHTKPSKNLELEGRVHAMKKVRNQLEGLNDIVKGVDFGLNNDGNINGVKVS